MYFAPDKRRYNRFWLQDVARIKITLCDGTEAQTIFCCCPLRQFLNVPRTDVATPWHWKQSPFVSPPAVCGRVAAKLQWLIHRPLARVSSLSHDISRLQSATTCALCLQEDIHETSAPNGWQSYFVFEVSTVCTWVRRRPTMTGGSQCSGTCQGRSLNWRLGWRDLAFLQRS